jgi:hypothetical protein
MIRPAAPNLMPQTIYYPMPGERASASAQVPAGQTGPSMTSSSMSAPVQRVEAEGPAITAAPPATAPVTVQGPIMQDYASMGPMGYMGVPASVNAASDVPSDPARCFGWMGGASAYLLVPFINDNVAFTADKISTTRTVNPATGAVTQTSTAGQRSTTTFDYDPSVSPGLWIGYLGPNGIGFRASYFRFDQQSQDVGATLTSAQASQVSPTSATAISIAPPTSITSNLPLAGFVVSAPTGVTATDTSGTGSDRLTFGSTLKVELIDLEAACNMQLGRCWSLFISGGARYLHLNENYLENVTGTGVPLGGTVQATETQDLSFGHNFTGVGPTLALEVRWAEPNCHWAFFGSARGALLVGRAGQSFFFSDTINDPNGILGNSTFTSQAGDHRDEVVPVGEIEVGVEYAVCLTSCRPYFRAACINQTYFGVGSASVTNTNLSLFGGEFSLGVDY